MINEEFVVDDNYIYFLSTDENSQICKYDIKNKKLIDISKYLLENSIKQVFNFIIDDNNIYFTIRMYDDYSDYPGNSILPKSWARVGFWEDYYNDDDTVLEEFLIAEKEILSED